ncbi:MAG: DUF3467 domain-containing protein [Chloroflexi bacterium]|nr:DUF3467 domain-containing protein [Chloroflexota bacterium]
MAAEKPKKQENTEKQGLALPLEWYVPESIISRYATNMAVQFSGQEFIISFFEARPPLVIGSPDVVKKELEQMQAVRAECVARIIVSKERMPVFVNVLQQQIQRSLGHVDEEPD